MIKAAFFDFYYTLVRYDPPREELQARALKEFGIDVSPEVFPQPLFIADEFIYKELAFYPLNQRSVEDKMSLYAQYQRILLKEAGISINPNSAHSP